MVISEKQIFQLLDIANIFIRCGEAILHEEHINEAMLREEVCKVIALLHAITNQQNDCLEEKNAGE